MIVSVANDLITCCLKRFGTGLVVLLLKIVDSAIDLKDEVLLHTAKIDDKAPDRVLTPKLESVDLTISKAIPKDNLGWRKLPAKLLRSYLCLRSAAPTAFGCLIMH
jgi:hypothetical protein